MNLAVLSSSTGASGAGFGAGDDTNAGSGVATTNTGHASFSRMLDSGNGNPGVDPATGRSRASDNNAADRGERAKAKPADANSGKDRAGQARPGDDADAAASTGASAADDTGDADQDDVATAADTPDGDGWPPPGLASLLGIAPPPVAATTTATAVTTAAEGEAGGDAGLLQIQAQAATDGAATEKAASGAASAVSNGLLPAIVSPAADGTTASDASAGDGAAPIRADASFAKLMDGLTAVAPQATDAPASMAPLLHGLQATTTTTAASSAIPVSAAPVVPQLHGAQFAEDIGTHVEWLADQKIGHAHIRISPQELGPVEIRLHLDGNRINADFSSAQPEVRQALENGLPRLREMLDQQGFQLAHAGVGQQSGNGSGGARQGSATGSDGESGELPGTAVPASPRLVRRGLLDAYA